VTAQSTLLTEWGGRWQTVLASADPPAVAVAQAISTHLTPDVAISELICTGRFEAAEDLCAAHLDPPIPSARLRQLRADLETERLRIRRNVERALEDLDLRARQAGGVLDIDREDLLELARLDYPMVATELSTTVELAVRAIENDRANAIRTRLDAASRRNATRDRVLACVRTRHWDAAERLIEVGQETTRRVAPFPSEVKHPPELHRYGTPLNVAQQLLERPGRLNELHGWPLPDDATRTFVEALLSPTPNTEHVVMAFDRMLGGEPTPSQDGRVVITAMEILPVPKPRFVGRQGLEVVIENGAAFVDDIVADIGMATMTSGPRLGPAEMMRVAIADGDRRIALLRVLGRQLPSQLLLSDLGETDNLEWALEWALDMVADHVIAPLPDVLLNTASGRLQLAQVLFLAVTPSPDQRGGSLTEQALENALTESSTQDALAQAFWDDLEHNSLSVAVLTAASLLEQPTGVTTRDGLVSYAKDLLEVLHDEPPDVQDLDRAIQCLHDRGYVRTNRDGTLAFELGTIRAVGQSSILH
jgi:hypothetical protein